MLCPSLGRGEMYAYRARPPAVTPRRREFTVQRPRNEVQFTPPSLRRRLVEHADPRRLLLIEFSLPVCVLELVRDRTLDAQPKVRLNQLASGWVEVDRAFVVLGRDVGLC